MQKQNTQQQTQWKGIFIGVLVLLGIGYLVSVILMKEESAKTNQRVELSQEANNSLNQLSSTGIETDTGKRLTTLASSGTNWGMSPFGSGKPLEEVKEEKPKFQKPNTEWKTRTLSGITYVFGEGNPREVALSASALQQEMRACEITPGSMARICREGYYGYLTPAIEQALKQVLESPLWVEYITQCEKEYFRQMPLGSDSHAFFQKYILTHGALDISRFIIVDSSTGRKELDAGYARNVASVLRSVGEDDMQVPYQLPCFSKHGGKDLADNMDNVTIMYSTNASQALQEWIIPY